MIIKVNDKMQKGYFYILTEKEGKNFAPDFKPELTPKEMLELGVFEGHYLTDCQNEFPRTWFKNAKIDTEKPNIELNYFKIKSRQSLQEWQRKRWIIGPDIRGWFQWYCRYFLGRRLPEIDRMQIARWRAFNRHKAQVLKNCPPKNLECRSRQRQALLQWAYNPFF